MVKDKINMTKEFLRSSFMRLFSGMLLVCLIPLVIYPKGELELIINYQHLPFLDVFFKYATHLGDGMVLALMLLALLFYNYSASILTAFSIVLQAIFVSIFKRWIFKGLERPLAFFNEGTELNFVEGVDVHSSNTFPSGHTATVFTIVALLFIIIKNKSFIAASMLLLVAVLVGFSRVYLLQHFIIDVYFGAIIGVISVVLGLFLMEWIFSVKKLNSFDQTSLRDIFVKKQKA